MRHYVLNVRHLCRLLLDVYVQCDPYVGPNRAEPGTGARTKEYASNHDWLDGTHDARCGNSLSWNRSTTNATYHPYPTTLFTTVVSAGVVVVAFFLVGQLS